MFRRRYSTFDPSPTNAPEAKFRYRAHSPPAILINDKQPRRDINAASLLPYLPPQQQHGFLSADDQPRRKISFSKKDKNGQKLHRKSCEKEPPNCEEIFARKARSLGTSPINRKKEFNELPLNANNLVITDNCQSQTAKPAIDVNIDVDDDGDILRSSNHVVNATKINTSNNKREQQNLLHSFGNSLGGNLRPYRKLSYPHNSNYNRSILQPLVFDTQSNKNVQNVVRKTSLDSSLQAHSPVHNALLLRRRSVYSAYNCESHQHPSLCVRTHWGVSNIKK